MDLGDNVTLSRTNKMTEAKQNASYVRGEKSTINRLKLFARVNNIETIIIPVLLRDFTI